MKKVLLAGCALLLMGSSASAATLVAANNPAPTLLGTFGPGTYTITASGLIDLVGPVGSGFTMRPDGVPDSPVTAGGYGYFNPTGSYIADGNYGPGGTVAKIGALMGSFTATPSSPSDYFLIGYSKSVTLASTQSIYGQVNDTFYSNNGGAFSVSVAAIPEPETWALMLVGFGAIGSALRRRQKVSVSFS